MGSGHVYFVAFMRLSEGVSWISKGQVSPNEHKGTCLAIWKYMFRHADVIVGLAHAHGLLHLVNVWNEQVSCGPNVNKLCPGDSFMFLVFFHSQV